MIFFCDVSKHHKNGKFILHFVRVVHTLQSLLWIRSFTYTQTHINRSSSLDLFTVVCSHQNAAKAHTNNNARLYTFVWNKVTKFEKKNICGIVNDSETILTVNCLYAALKNEYFLWHQLRPFKIIRSIVLYCFHSFISNSSIKFIRNIGPYWEYVPCRYK